MEMRVLGNSGVKVSVLCLGAMALGALGNTDREDCVRIIHAALDRGINTIDTADMYSKGESEEIVGRALLGRRSSVVLATKCFWPTGPDPNERGLSRRHIVATVDNSLRRLQTDWIDVLYLHKPDPDTAIEESLGAASDLVASGKVRLIGTSSFPAEQLVEANWVAQSRHLARPGVEQPAYSLLARGAEVDVLPVCERQGTGVMVFSPLNGGWLTGKYRPGAAVTADSRAARWPNDPSMRLTSPIVSPQIRTGGTAVRCRSPIGLLAHPTGHRLRHRASRRHLRDHRPAHHEPAGGAPRAAAMGASTRPRWIRSTRSWRPGSTWIPPTAGISRPD